MMSLTAWITDPMGSASRHRILTPVICMALIPHTLTHHTLTHHTLTGEVGVSLRGEYNGCEL